MDTELPLVSIVLPTYNRAALVGNAIESVLAQTYPAIELIVVNNGSTDHTAHVLERWASHPRVRVVSIQVNGGVYKAYNVGVPLARGKYAAFLYDDDTLLPDAIEVLARRAEDLGPTVGLIFGDCVDPQTGETTGHGLEREGRVTFEDVMRGKLVGEYFGIWHVKAFGTRRFDEDCIGAEGLVWWDMYRSFDGYYVRRPTRQYTRFGADSISRPRLDPQYIAMVARTSQRYIDAFGDDMRRIDPRSYAIALMRSARWDILDHRRSHAARKLFAGLAVQRSLAGIGIAILSLGGLLLPASTYGQAILGRHYWQSTGRHVWSRVTRRVLHMLTDDDRDAT